MRKLVLKTLALSLPFLAALLYVESRLEKMPNTYRNKREALERALPRVEVLALGSSNSFYAINPDYFSVPGFNAAYRVQSHWYDTRIALKYLDRMPCLKVVLIPIIYLTFGTTQDDHQDMWRVFFYEQDFGLPPSPDAVRRAYGLSYWLDPRRFSRIALYAEKTQDYVLGGFREKIGEDFAENGWFDPGSFLYDPELPVAEADAGEHNRLTSTGRYADNLRHIKMLTDELKRRGIKPVLLQLPAHPDIVSLWDAEKLRLMDRNVEDFARAEGIAYVNYMRAEGFGDADYSVMPDHLNARGARKISLMLDRDIILPAINPAPAPPGK